MKTDRRARFEDNMLPHLEALQRTALWITMRGRLAEDLVLKTMGQAYRQTDEHSDHFSVKVRLFRILAREFFRFGRQGQRRDRSTPYRAVPTRSTECPDGWNSHITMSSIEHSQLRNLIEVPGMLVKGAIAHLNPYSRLMLVLLYREQFTYADIGYITDLPRTSVRAVLTRLRTRIPRNILEFAGNANRTNHSQPVDRTSVGEVHRERRRVYLEFPFISSSVISADAAAERWENEGGALVSRNGG